MGLDKGLLIAKVKENGCFEKAKWRKASDATSSEKTLYELN